MLTTLPLSGPPPPPPPPLDHGRNNRSDETIAEEEKGEGRTRPSPKAEGRRRSLPQLYPRIETELEILLVDEKGRSKIVGLGKRDNLPDRKIVGGGGFKRVS